MSVVLLLCPTVLLLCATVLLLCARFEELLSATSDRSMLSFSALASPSRAPELAVELASDLARLLMAGLLLPFRGESTSFQRLEQTREAPAKRSTSVHRDTRRKGRAHRARSTRKRWEMLLAR